MMKTVKHTFSSIGEHGGDLARTIGSGTAGLAKRIGPRRGLISLAVIAAAIGTSIVVARYLRARKTEAEAGLREDALAGRPMPSRYDAHAAPAGSIVSPRHS